MSEELLKYFHGDELAASTWKNKYALEGETTPDEMHRRMAKEFTRIEWNYRQSNKSYDINSLSEYGKKLQIALL